MQTATPRPAEIAPASTATSRPQSLVDTATFKLDATTVAPTKAPKPPGAPTGPCPKCESPDPWGNSAWCLQCGFYPKLGICIPVEAIKSAHEEEQQLVGSEIPPWVKRLGIGCAVILLIDVVARLQLPADGPRTILTIVQASVGLFLLIASHVQAYVFSGSGDDKLGFFDLLSGPQKVWRAPLEALPKTSWLVTRGVWGLTALVFAFLVVGGIGWQEINDAIAARVGQQKKFKPLAAIASLANAKGGKGQGDGTENVEDAMNKFVDELGVNNLQTGGGAPVAEADPGLRKQCAIVGFTKNVDGELKSVLLATVSGGQPQEYVAKVPVNKLPDTVVSKLANVLPDMRTSRPAVDCPIKAYWVKPELTCTMAFEEVPDQKDWSDVKFVEMLNAAGVKFDAKADSRCAGGHPAVARQVAAAVAGCAKAGNEAEAVRQKHEPPG
ncbi:MAG: hypothetical protein U0992_19290 [Planctomycetaceae bacterium]